MNNLPNQGIEFINDEAVRIRPKQKEIILKNFAPLAYDILVLATGADYNLHQFPKLCSAGYNLHTIEGVTALRQALIEFTGGKIVFLITALPVKCPGAAYEAAFLLNHLLSKKGLQDKTEIHIYTPEQAPLIKFGPAVSAFTFKQLLKQKITTHYESTFLKVKPFRKRLKFTTGEVDYDLLIYVPPHQGSSVIQKSRLGDDQGWVTTDPSHLTTSYADILALGDAADIRLPNGESLIKCGAVATLQSNVICKNIMAIINGRKPTNNYPGWTGYVLEIGNGQSVITFGNLYTKSDPRIFTTPVSRIWRLSKRYIEYDWLHKIKAH